MKKINFVAVMLLCGLTAFGQAVKDRNVIPVAVNLNQVLRMTITNGGNIEFVFNTIDQYKNGITAVDAVLTDVYRTDFSVASSTRWELSYGAEEAAFIGTDNPGHSLALNNVGFKLAADGNKNFNAAGVHAGVAASPSSLISEPTENGTQVTALQAYPVVLITDAGAELAAGSTEGANAGDAADNKFILNWRCGTVETAGVTPMNSVALIEQATSPVPDRYVVNVLFELAAK